MSTLHLSAFEGDERSVRGRIELGENPNARDEDGRTPLHWAAAGGHQDLVEYLVEIPGAVIDSEDDDGMTPLLSAVAANKLGVAAVLLGRGADPKKRTSSGQSCLHFHKARPSMLRFVLGHVSSTEVNAQDARGSTPLHRCVCGEDEDHLEAVNLLLEAGARPNAWDRMGNTPLHLASEEGLRILAKRLLDAGADPALQNKDGQKAAPWAL